MGPRAPVSDVDVASFSSHSSTKKYLLGRHLSARPTFFGRCTRVDANRTIPSSTRRRDYPEGEVILGMELRMHSLKAAPVDTANAEFQRPGVTTALDDVS